MKSICDQILENITEEKWLKLATQLIKTGQPMASDPLDPDLPPAQEEAIAMLVAGKLEALGMEVNTYESMPHRPNVVGILKGIGDGPVLMMNDHMDTYPVVEPHKWDKTNFDPFQATRHGAVGALVRRRQHVSTVWPDHVQSHTPLLGQPTQLVRAFMVDVLHHQQGCGQSSR